MADESPQDIRQRLYGIAECSVCLQTFKEPRTLPCQHTYCSRCIAGVIESNRISDDMPSCPLCRKEFAIPENGVDGLPRNIFIEQLKDVANLHSASLNCEACSGAGTTAAKQAVKYCAVCQQRFCKSCADHHPQIRATSDHKLIGIGDAGEEANRDAAAKMAAAAAVAYCEKHPNKSLELYCFDCDAVTCVKCFVEDHHVRSHSCSDVNVVADEFRGHLTSDASLLGGTVEQCRDLLAELAEGKAELIARAGVVEQEVDRRVEQLKQQIDDERQALLAELASSVGSRVKQIERVVSDIEEHRSSVENLIRCTEELGNGGSAVVVAQQHNVLRRRAGELLRLDDVDRAMVDLGGVDVSFVSMKLQLEHGLLGKIVTKRRAGRGGVAKAPTAPTWTCAVPGGDSIVGLTSLDDRLFVLRDPSRQLVEVYDAETFTLLQPLDVPELSHRTGRCGLDSCSTSRCLYVSDYDANAIRKVDMTSDHRGSVSWLVADGPTGLSTNSARNVLVACCNANKIQEFSTHGTLVREIQLHADVADPVHAVQLSSGVYVVSHWEPEYGITVVDIDGRVVVTYRNKRRSLFSFFSASSSPEVLLNRPGHLAVAASGIVYSAETDTESNRIVLFDPTTGSARDLIASIALDGPWSLFLDKSRDQLYVGECGSGRVLLVENVSKM